MKFYIKKYKDIKEIKEARFIFVPEMRKFCGRGPFEFVDANVFEDVGDKWLKIINGIAAEFVFHKSWLTPYLKDKQYLLEF